MTKNSSVQVINNIKNSVTKSENEEIWLKPDGFIKTIIQVYIDPVVQMNVQRSICVV